MDFSKILLVLAIIVFALAMLDSRDPARPGRFQINLTPLGLALFAGAFLF